MCNTDARHNRSVNININTLCEKRARGISIIAMVSSGVKSCGIGKNRLINTNEI